MADMHMLIRILQVVYVFATLRHFNGRTFRRVFFRRVRNLLVHILHIGYVSYRLR